MPTYNIFKYKSEGVLRVDYVVQRHNVGVLQAFQK